MFGLTPYERKSHLKAAHPSDFFDYFFNNLCNDFTSMFPGSMPSFKTDIRENAGEYVIDAEMPGMKKEDIKLNIEDDVLTITVEKSEDSNEESGSYIRRERHFGSSSRNFRIGNVKQDAVEAKFENGVLTVILPKLGEEPAKGRAVDIN